MSFKRSVLAFLLVYTHVVTLFAVPSNLLRPSRSVAQKHQSAGQDLDALSKKAHSLVVNIPSKQGHSQFSYTEIPLKDPSQIGEFLERRETLKADVLLSTDVTEIYKSVAQAVQKTESQSNRKFRFMPIGKLAEAKQKLASGWASYKEGVFENLKYDKLGLSIAVITTGVDSFIWIHSGSLDVYQKSAMVIFNVLFTAAFVLDTDMWSKMTGPLNHRIIKTLDKMSKKVFGQSETEGRYLRRVLASQVLTNLTYSAGFQLLRSSIMSYHDLASAVTSTPFWVATLQVATITTFSSFAWGELTAKADFETNPVARNALKRIGNVRSLIMSRFASMGMVLQPHQYGYSPILTIVASGAFGLFALINSNRVITLLEKSRVSNVIFDKQRKYESLINEAVESLAHELKSGNSCSMLFN